MVRWLVELRETIGPRGAVLPLPYGSAAALDRPERDRPSTVHPCGTSQGTAPCRLVSNGPLRGQSSLGHLHRCTVSSTCSRRKWRRAVRQLGSKLHPTCSS